MGSRWKRVSDAYVRFVDGKGFAVLATLCAAVIAGTAVWTSGGKQPYSAPTPPVMEDQSASVLMQQSVKSVATPTPLPAVNAPVWQPPLPELTVLRAFSSSAMTRSGVTGIWAVHDGVDLQAALGDPVFAVADGTVTACGEDGLAGMYVEIRHDGGYVSRCMGLEMTGALRVGDRVRAGQTVGFVGNRMIDEVDLGDHLHLELSLDGNAVDPLSVFQ